MTLPRLRLPLRLPAARPLADLAALRLRLPASDHILARGASALAHPGGSDPRSHPDPAHRPAPGIRPADRLPSPGPLPPAPPSVQGWLPVTGVEDGLIIRADGTYVAALRIIPVPLGLLSERERERRITALHEALQGLPGAAQLLSVPRPVDLDAYLGHLAALLCSAAGPRRTLLAGYQRYVQGLGAGGEATERRFFVLLRGDGADEATLRQRTTEFAASLGRAGLNAHTCDDRELADLLFAFLHPLQAAVERATPPVPAPRYVPELEANGREPD